MWCDWHLDKSEKFDSNLTVIEKKSTCVEDLTQSSIQALKNSEKVDYWFGILILILTCTFTLYTIIVMGVFGIYILLYIYGILYMYVLRCLKNC